MKAANYSVLMILCLILFACQKDDESFVNTINESTIQPPNTGPGNVSFTTANIDGISNVGGITKYFPSGQESYTYSSAFFKFEHESNSYSRLSVSEKDSCHTDEACDLIDFVYTSYTSNKDCSGDNCPIGTVCFVIKDGEPLLFSAAWNEDAARPENLPENCLTTNGNGNTYFDCVIQPEGTEHPLVQSDSFIQFSTESTDFASCFNQ